MPRPIKYTLINIPKHTLIEYVCVVNDELYNAFILEYAMCGNRQNCNVIITYRIYISSFYTFYHGHTYLFIIANSRYITHTDNTTQIAIPAFCVIYTEYLKY